MLAYSWIPAYFLPGYLLLLLLAQVLFRKGIVRGRHVFTAFAAAAVAYVLGIYVLLTYLQYISWKSHPFTEMFLPPYAPYAYLLQFHLVRFALYHLIAMTVAAVFWLAAYRANARSGGAYFESEEIPIAASVIVLLGSPTLHYGWISYALVLLIGYLVWQVLAVYRWKKSASEQRGEQPPRVPMYYLWVPCALLVILIEYLISV